MSYVFRATKDPGADLDYSIDWSHWLGTDTILTSTWSAAEGSGLTLHDPSHAGTEATVWIGGGMPGRAWAVTNRIVTAGGRTDERSILLRIDDR